MTLCELYRAKEKPLDEAGPDRLIELAKRDSDPEPGDVELLKSELTRLKMPCDAHGQGRADGLSAGRPGF